MAITFPRELPTFDFETCDFNIVRNDAVNRAGGRISSHELFDPFWMVKATTFPLVREERAKWQAWNMTLKGAAKPFFMYDPDRPFPLAYGKSVLNLTRSGGGSYDGTMTVTAATAATVSLSGAPGNYQASAGDHISLLLSTGKRSLHAITEDVGFLSGGTGTVPVEPPIIGTVSLAGGGAQLVRAKCEFRMVKFDAPASENPIAITFEATS